jgi:hypothetical protein
MASRREMREKSVLTSRRNATHAWFTTILRNGRGWADRSHRVARIGCAREPRCPGTDAVQRGGGLPRPACEGTRNQPRPHGRALWGLVSWSTWDRSFPFLPPAYPSVSLHYRHQFFAAQI